MSRSAWRAMDEQVINVRAVGERAIDDSRRWNR